MDKQELEKLLKDKLAEKGVSKEWIKDKVIINFGDDEESDNES
jgi:hypothetical protein